MKTQCNFESPAKAPQFRAGVRWYTTDSLSPALAEKLAKICGQFGADNDHLVLVAARAAHRLVKEAGATWPEAFQPLPEPEQCRKPEPEWTRQPFKGTWQDAVSFASRYLYSLPTKEREFIRQLSDYTHAPTEKQQKWLRDIVERLFRQGARRWA